MGLASVFDAAVSSGLATGVGLVGDMTGILGVLVGIGLFGAAFAIVAAFVKR